jgi:hypothetical protein
VTELGSEDGRVGTGRLDRGDEGWKCRYLFPRHRSDVKVDHRLAGLDPGRTQFGGTRGEP